MQMQIDVGEIKISSPSMQIAATPRVKYEFAYVLERVDENVENSAIGGQQIGESESVFMFELPQDLSVE